MEIATLIIAIVALFIAVPTIVGDVYQFIKTKRDSRFAAHCTCVIEEDENNGSMFISVTCINHSLEPYSVLRIDYICGNEIQSIGLGQFHRVSASTLVPPQEILRLERIDFAISKEIILQADTDPTIIRGIILYTTKRNNPYLIPLFHGADDSAKALESQLKKFRKFTKKNLIKLSKRA